MIEYKTIGCEYNEAPKKGNYHVIDSIGDQFWYVNGELHRDNDLPAVILVDGTQYWIVNGKLHRDNDLPAIIFANGKQEWYQNGRQYTP